ncbi:hypothetical protein BGX27_005232 [Mortierella sp. AM989]|nr:hypothetical protein BGX27_005232 [Mortierella sp. AM989]
MPPQLLQERTSAIPNKLQPLHEQQQQQQQTSLSLDAISEQNDPSVLGWRTPTTIFPSFTNSPTSDQPTSSPNSRHQSDIYSSTDQHSKSSPQKLRVAIIGSGLAGLTVAHLLSSLHSENGNDETEIDVHLFEKTHQIEYHPCLVLLYRTIGIKFHAANNTVSCSDLHLDSDGNPRYDNVQVPYFSSRSYKIGSRTVTLPDLPPFSILNPFPLGRRVLAYFRITRDYARMLIISKEFMSKGRMMDIGKHPIEWGNGRMVSLREFLEAGGYSHDFSSFFVPRVASVCTCSFERMMEYPACVVLEYMARCNPFGRLMALTSFAKQELVEKLSESIGTVHYNTTIKHIQKGVGSEMRDGSETPIILTDSFGVQRSFDHVIFATQANQAAAILASYDVNKDKKRFDQMDSVSPLATSLESLKPEHPFYRQIKTLIKFPYERISVICHTDTSFLPKDPSHWRSLNIAKPFSADILASPINKIAKELEEEMKLRSKDAKFKPSIFSLRSSPFSGNKSKSLRRTSSFSRLRAHFAPLTHPSDNSLTLDSNSTCQNSVMATYIMNKTSHLGSSTSFLQTINPTYLPRPDTLISSTWLDRVVVNSTSMKAVDELQRLMDQQSIRRANRDGERLQREQDQDRTPVTANTASISGSDGIWFVGSYTYPGIPLLEGSVASAVRVAEQIIASEPTRRLVVPSATPLATFWERTALVRERNQHFRRESIGRKGNKRQATMSAVYFQTAWKNGLEDDLLEQNKRYVRPYSLTATLEVAWIVLLYLVAFAKWLLVFVLESFGGDGSRWACT